MRWVVPWWLLVRPAALGNAGAVANARRACRERELAEHEAEALARRLPPAVLPTRPGSTLRSA